jgi:hypothetical protein
VELTYVLVHNAARLFFQKAEKIDDKYMKTAQQLYKYVLDMDYVKENKELLAMLNINAGMAFQYDENDKFENAKKALAYYECGKDLYESIDEVNYQSEIANAELDIAAAYKTIYHFTGDEKDFRKCLDLTNGIIGKIKYSPKNSLLLRTYLMQLYLYLEAVKCGQTPSGLIDLEHVRNKLSIMSSQINYEKYKYTYQF